MGNEKIDDSDSSDECVITDFIPAEPDQPKTIKSENFDVNQVPTSWRNNFIMKPVAGDGHCISSCFAEYFNEDIVTVLLKLKEEFKSNFHIYLSYSSMDVDVMDELEQYINLKRYNSGTFDLILRAFSAIYKCQVNVYDAEGQLPPQDFQSSDISNGKIGHINLLKNSDHYNLLIPVNSVLPGTPNSKIIETPESEYVHFGTIEDEIVSEGDPGAKNESYVLDQSWENEESPPVYVIEDNKDDNEENSFVREGDTDCENEESPVKERYFTLNYGNPSATSLFMAIMLAPEKILERKPLKAIRENKVFTLSTYDHEAIMCDDNGAYQNTKNVKTYYQVKFLGNDSIKVQTAHFDGKDYFIKERESRNYVDTKVSLDGIYTIERTYRDNKSISGLRHLVARVRHVKTNAYEKYCCVIYSLSEEKALSKMEILPHGNSKKASVPYIRTSKRTLEQADLILEKEKRPTMVYGRLLAENNPLQTSSQSDEPRNTKQIQNRKYLKNLAKKKESTAAIYNDEVLKLLSKQRSDSFIKNVSVTDNSYYAFLYDERQLIDIQHFCCTEDAPVPLGIDTTFNLCDLWLTDTSYKNKRILNSSGKHPVFLGPSMLHFKKDDEPFRRFAAELIVSNSALHNLRFIGVDMETAIYNGIKSQIRDVKRLICVRHLKARDESKLVKLLEKTKQSAAQKTQSKAEVLKDIYGEKTGSCYEYGLAEYFDQEEFAAKLESLRDKWNALVPGFHVWFEKHRKELFTNSVIESARKNADISGLYYQNDVESMHAVQKCIQNYQESDVLEVVHNLELLLFRQSTEEIRALYGGGTYTLHPTYQMFRVESSEWHSWTGERRRDHIEKFRNFVPSISQSFKKPKNAGRKPSYQKRLRGKEPDIIVDRHESVVKKTKITGVQSKELSATNSQNNGNDNSGDSEKNESRSKQDDTAPVLNQSLRSADPRVEPDKKFELHCRELLPSKISKCQGNCGVKIKTTDTLLVRSYGKSEWTDKSTGELKSKHGPLYIHFNGTCLKRFDKAKIYGPDETFYYARMEIDKESRKRLSDMEVEFLRGLGVNI